VDLMRLQKKLVVVFMEQFNDSRSNTGIKTNQHAGHVFMPVALFYDQPNTQRIYKFWQLMAVLNLCLAVN